MEFNQNQDDGLPPRNRWHSVIIWCGNRFSKRWRGWAKHTNLRLELALERAEELAIERGSLQSFNCDFDYAYAQASGTLAMVLQAISTDAFCQWPIGGGTCKWMLAQIDWQAVAKRVIIEHWFNFDLYN